MNSCKTNLFKRGTIGCMEMRIKKNSAQLKRSLQGVEKSFSGVDKCG